MLSKAKNIFLQNSPVAKNMTWLTLLQFANYLIPLLIIPYIVRVLGAETFGKVSYAQNIISYFTLIINFGFDYSATREIAINKNNTEIRNSIFWSVIKQKAILLVFTFIALIILYFSFEKVQSDFTLYLFVFLLNLGVVVFPVWFYQGMEDMKRMALFNILVRSSGLLLTFIFVKNISEYLLYPLLISIGYIFCGFISFVQVIRHYNISFTFRNKDIDRKLFWNSSPVFLNMLFASFYSTANLTILGFFYDNYTLGIYGGAQKIIIAILMLTSTPVSIALFPKISREFNASITEGKILFNRIFKIIFIYGFIASFVTFISSELLVKILLGKEFYAAIPLLKVFSLLPLLVIIASLFTIQGLYGAGLQKYAPYIGGSLGIISIISNLLLVPKYGITGAGWIWVVTEVMEIIIAASFFYWKLKSK
jgi:polysaccharide transporter, PST family